MWRESDEGFQNHGSGARETERERDHVKYQRGLLLSSARDTLSHTNLQLWATG